MIFTTPATINGFRKMLPDHEFQVQPLSTLSGVADQPMSDGETLHGARTRVRHAREQVPHADYWIAIEGGVEFVDEELFAFGWIVITARCGSGKARTGTFVLPPAVAQLVRQGIELGVANDLVFHRSNLKQADGAVGILTDNIIDRMRLYEQAVMLACVSLKNEELYKR